MDNVADLSPATQAIFETIVNYHADRLRAFERDRAARTRIPDLYDGKYSLTRLLHAQGEHRVPQLAPHELGVSQKIAETLGREPEPGYAFVPIARRDLTASLGSGGGFLVATGVAPGDMFVGALLATLRAKKLGMPVIPMEGNASIPRISGTVTTGWLGTEGQLIAESDLAFAVAAATPKHVGAYTEISGQLLRQTTPFAQNFVLIEIARAVAAALDRAIIQGSGAAGQPQGILDAAGIGSISGASLAWSGVLDVVHAVENGDAVVNPAALGWAIPPTTAKLLRAREKATGSGFIIDDANRMAGYPVDATNSVPAATALFGDWSGAALLEWAVLQVGADPYGVNSALFVKNLVGIRALWTCDLIVLRAKSFCKSTGIS